MRNPSRLQLIASLLASLVSLGLGLQLGLLLLLGTGVTLARQSLALRPVQSSADGGGERVTSAASRALPRTPSAVGRRTEPRAERAQVRGRVAARVDSRPGLRPAADSGPPPSLRQPSQGAAGPPSSSLFFLDVRAPATGLPVTVTGLDLEAPRDLVLWQVNEERRRAAPLARGSSRADGLFELTRLLLPPRGVRLVLTAEGGDPFDRATAAVLELAPLAPLPPRAWIDLPPAGAASPPQLRAVPDSRDYELSLGDATGREFARLSIPGVIPAATDPRLASRPLRFEIDELPHWIAREQSDGTRSVWSPIPTRQLAGAQPELEETQ